MRSKLFKSEADGFTLIEILVALAILALAIPSLLQSFNMAAEGQAISENRTTALYLLKYQIALIETQGFPDIGSDEGEFGEGSRFTWSSEIADVESEELQGLRSIAVTVFWQEKGKEKSISIHTLISDRQMPQQQNQQNQQGQNPNG